MQRIGSYHEKICVINDTCVVDQDVDSLKALLDGLEHVLDLSDVGCVCLIDLAADTRSGDLFLSCPGSFVVARIVKGYVIAFFREL